MRRAFDREAVCRMHPPDMSLEKSMNDHPTPSPNATASMQPSMAQPQVAVPALDRIVHAALARFTFGLSPAALAQASMDWRLHLAGSPMKRMELASELAQALANGVVDWMRALQGHALVNNDAGDPALQVPDQRFADPAWQRYPFNLYAHAFLQQQAWWQHATSGVRGVSGHHEQMVAFMARQWLDMLAPTNSPFTNPEVIEATLKRNGMNLLEGSKLFMDDMQRALGGQPPAGSEHFIPGHQVAVTPGKVVLRNRLAELIQYSPSTPQVHAEPVLIVPAWIMKYYILDLSPGNSLVKYLVDQGHTVFMISWKNPDAGDRDLGMDDYLTLGPLAALDAVQRIVPGRKVHAAGYCLGGTLLAIAAAMLGARGDRRLATLSLLASQVDFTEPGELSLFIDDSQVSFLEDMMWAQGYLDTTQMAGAFQMLRSYDLIWSRMTHDYLMGQRRPPNDLMAWNADATRMPYRMHSEYLRGMYLNNDLAEGRWRVDGQAVSVEDAPQPWFVVGTESDHVAPWSSVYKIHLLAHSEITFVLTTGGHNAGIVSEPGHAGRHYHWGRREPGRPYLDPQHWLQQAAREEGSWWPRWSAWLAAHSSPPRDPPPLGVRGAASLGDAPGEYVLQR